MSEKEFKPCDYENCLYYSSIKLVTNKHQIPLFTLKPLNIEIDRTNQMAAILTMNAILGACNFCENRKGQNNFTPIIITS